jgi:ATP-dependent DNA ligase
MRAYEDFMEQGYEGAMIRNAEGDYEHRRSYNLQKLKKFQDAEFEVIGISEGRGSLAGHAAAFVCRIDDSHGKRTFEAKLKGKNVTAFLKKCFEDHSLWEGKWLKVQFQGWTRKNRVPRFPVGLHFRDAE